MRPDVRAALRDMLGAPVGIGLADPAAPAEGLWPKEARAMTRALPARRAEFAAGRRAARAAMAEIGLPAAAIPQGADRAPLWPAGLTGSIAHCDGACIAVVSTTHASLGIDIEPATPLDADLIEVVCTAPERAWVARQPDPGMAAKHLFVAKEAVYKAQYPMTGRVIGFDAVTLAVTEDQRFGVAGPGDLPTLSGQIRQVAGLILAVCLHQDHVAVA